MKQHVLTLSCALALMGACGMASAASYRPADLLATLVFDGKDWSDSGEQNFPQAFRFTSYDSNIERNKENLVRFKIGNNVSGTGSTGLANRGPNDQRPAVYFHYVERGGYEIYQYWLYYADNDWINDHEHDWEKYFVYVKNRVPTHLLLSNHNNDVMYSWANVPKDNGHPVIGVDGGSHAMKLGAEDGVRIRYNGQITANGGRLDQGNWQTIPWVIYSNHSGFPAVRYTPSPNTFYGGDPAYITNSNEYGSPIAAPWTRPVWSTPPLPN
jgi:hypothetical protein